MKTWQKPRKLVLDRHCHVDELENPTVLVCLAQARLLLCGRTPSWVECARDVSLYHTVLYWHCTLCTLTWTDPCPSGFNSSASLFFFLTLKKKCVPQFISEYIWILYIEIDLRYLFKNNIWTRRTGGFFDPGFGCVIMGWRDSALLHTLSTGNERGLTNPRCRGPTPHSHRRWTIIGGHCKLSKKILRKLRSWEPYWYINCMYWVIVWDMTWSNWSLPKRLRSSVWELEILAEVSTSWPKIFKHPRIVYWYFPPNWQPILCVWLQYRHVSERYIGCRMRFFLIPFIMHIH